MFFLCGALRQKLYADKLLRNREIQKPEIHEVVSEINNTSHHTLFDEFIKTVQVDRYV